MPSSDNAPDPAAGDDRLPMLEDLARAAFAEGAHTDESALIAAVRRKARRWLASRPDEDAIFPGYAIEHEIGRGGMGIVFRAHEQTLGRDVAIKVLNRGQALNASMVERFEAEARIGARLQHPGIVPVLEGGRFSSDHRPYFTMRLVEGDTLAERLAARTDPEGERAALFDVFDKVCQAIAYAHSRGIVHRDLKPANVMIGNFGEVQVMDWGLAKVLAQRSASGGSDGTAADGAAPPSSVHSLDGTVMGTLPYMPPEQARGERDHIDQRSDVFALGAILLEILTGRPPYAGASATELRDRARRGDVTEGLAALDAVSADAELARLVRRCLATAREDRPPDGAAVADAFRAYLESAEERLRLATLDAARADERAGTERTLRKRTTWAAAAVVAAVLSVAGVAWFVVADRAERRGALEGDILADLADAERRLADGADDERTGAEALRRFDHAIALARDPLVSPHLRTRAQARRDALAERLARARTRRLARERDERMLERLVACRARPDGADLDIHRRITAYRDAFRDYGIPLPGATAAGETVNVTAAARAIEASTIARELVAALVDLARLHAGRRDRSAAWGPVVDIIARVSPSPLLAALREHPDDRARLLALVEPHRFRGESAATLDAFAASLRVIGADEHERRVLTFATRAFPRDFWVHFSLAESYRRLDDGRHPLALAYARAAVALRPKSARAWTSLGMALAAHGFADEALRAADRVMALSAAPAHDGVNTGRIALLAKRPADGARYFRRALAATEENAPAHAGLGAALAAERRWPEACDAYRRALALDPRDAGARRNYGNALRRTGAFDEAEAAYTRAAADAEDPGESVESRRNLVFLDIHRRRFASARDRADAALRVAPDHPYLHYGRALALRSLGQSAAAYEAVERAAALAPTTSTFLTAWGGWLVNDGHPRRGLTLLTRARRADPRDARAHENAGNAYAMLEDWTAAHASYRRALDLRPDRALLAFLTGHTLERLGRYTEALPLLERGHRRGASSPNWPYRSAVEIRRCRTRARIARELAQKIATVGEASHREAIEIATVAARAGRVLEAARVWRRLLEDDGFRPLLEHRRQAAVTAARVAASALTSPDENATPPVIGWATMGGRWLDAGLDQLEALVASAATERAHAQAVAFLDRCRRTAAFTRLVAPHPAPGITDEERLRWIKRMARIERIRARLIED